MSGPTMLKQMPFVAASFGIVTAQSEARGCFRMKQSDT
jgi:hypothetical protein